MTNCCYVGLTNIVRLFVQTQSHYNLRFFFLNIFRSCQSHRILKVYVGVNKDSFYSFLLMVLFLISVLLLPCFIEMQYP